jgi:hypothetical protein
MIVAGETRKHGMLDRIHPPSMWCIANKRTRALRMHWEGAAREHSSRRHSARRHRGPLAKERGGTIEQPQIGKLPIEGLIHRGRGPLAHVQRHQAWRSLRYCRRGDPPVARRALIVARRLCRQPPALRSAGAPLSRSPHSAFGDGARAYRSGKRSRHGCLLGESCSTKDTVAEASATASFGVTVMHRQSANDDRTANRLDPHATAR